MSVNPVRYGVNALEVKSSSGGRQGSRQRSETGRKSGGWMSSSPNSG